MSWSALLGDAAPRREPSPLEAERFGLSVDRILVPDASRADDADIRDLVAGSDADLVILRHPARRVRLFASLLGTGRDVIGADQLIYWRLHTGTGRRPAPVPGVEAVEGPVDPALVAALVGEIFTGYGNHYVSNPVLDPALALAGYQEWAERSAAHGAAVLHRRREAVGIATTSAEDGVVEIELAGVLAAHQGQGLYGHLLAGVEDRAAAVGAADVVISTQAHNTGVQRAWARYGFEPVTTFSTVHLLRTGLLDPGPQG